MVWLGTDCSPPPFWGSQHPPGALPPLPGYPFSQSLGETNVSETSVQSDWTWPGSRGSEEKGEGRTEHGQAPRQPHSSPVFHHALPIQGYQFVTERPAGMLKMGKPSPAPLSPHPATGHRSAALRFCTGVTEAGRDTAGRDAAGRDTAGRDTAGRAASRRLTALTPRQCCFPSCRGCTCTCRPAWE